MNLHKHRLYLLEQHSESFKIWSAINRTNIESKSLIMKLGPNVSSLCYYIYRMLLSLLSLLHQACVAPLTCRV